MSVPTKKDVTNSDSVFARSLLYLDDSTRNLQSWLPANLKRGSTSAEKEEVEVDIEGDEEEGGLGYSAPKSSLANDRQSLSANEKLRKQLLGNRSSLSHGQGRTKNQLSNGFSASKPKPQPVSRSRKDSDDETEGRTSTNAKKSTAKSTARPSQQKNSSESGQPTPSTTSKKRSTSYLDEVLAQRKNKKSKSQKD